MSPRQDFTSDGLSNVEQLRTALAINRGMEFIKNLPQEVDSTVEHDEGQRLDYLVKLYTRIHEEIFKNWKQEGIQQRPGQISPEGIITLRRALLDTLCYPNGERDEANDRHRQPLFDSNGFVIRHSQDDLAGMLGDFYLKMNKVKPFKYGNELTLNLFMTALGKLPAYEAVFDAGIDFRRMGNDDYAALHTDHPDRQAYKTAFSHAMDFSRTPELDNKRDGHGSWEKHVKHIHGVRFLSQTAQDGTECLVTVNGGLVPLKSIEKDLISEIESNKPLADYPPIPPGQIKEYLPGTEKLRDKTDIDGIPVGKDGSAPLLCLDFNILTGLSTRGHEELEQLIKRVEGDKTPVFRLANNEGLRKKLIDEAGADERMRRMIDIAYEHLSTVTPRMNELEKEIFKGKTYTPHPIFVESFGGAGSGKTSVIKGLMKTKCGGDNYVVASLDSFREHSDLYKVVVAAGHHSDDYRVVEPFAKELRTWVAAKARNENINVLYDGTGIPFEPSYSALAKDFKGAHYRTEVVAVDVPLPVAAERVVERFEGEKDPAKKRALPWIVTIGKHVRSFHALLQAIQVPNVDKVSLFANERGEGQHYLVAETFLHHGASPQQSASALDTLRDRALSHPDSTLRSLSTNEKGTEELLGRIPGFKKGNVFNISYALKNGANRDLAIYDVSRFNQFLDKGLVNPYASGPEGWDKLPKRASFVMRRTAESGENMAAQL